MPFICIVLLYTMENLMMGSEYKGDIHGDPPPLFSEGRGQHNEDGKCYYDL